MNPEELHPYVRYAAALVSVENGPEGSAARDFPPSPASISAQIRSALGHFRVKPATSYNGAEKVKFSFAKVEKGNPKKGIFLAPHVISSDKQAKDVWKAAKEVVGALTSNPNKLHDVRMSFAPIAGEFLNFSSKGSIGRGKPKVSAYELALATLTTLTPIKPSLQYRIDKKDRPDMFNVCIIPDISIEAIAAFIEVFKRMQKQQLDSDLMFGKVRTEETGKGTKSKTHFIPQRPLLFRGNFPNPPRSSALGSVALLGAIGEFAKEAKYSKKANCVLDSLGGATMYLIKYGGAQTFTYNHHVVALAKAGKLKTIVDSVYHTKLHNQDRRSGTNTEYQKFDLFASRFMQLFNRSAFQDFLAFRAEYQAPVGILLNTYFTEVEQVNKIHPQIVTSARALGRWLNQVAYFTARSEVAEGKPNYWEELRKAKAKVLVELESSAFAAKSGDALIAQVVTRAGRLSGMDAPEAATVFMEQTASGELLLDQAKNLVVAFSRLINKAEKKEQAGMPEPDATADENEDHSDI